MFASKKQMALEIAILESTIGIQIENIAVLRDHIAFLQKQNERLNKRVKELEEKSRAI